MRKRRVIVFDDDRVVLSMMKYFFSLRGGYEVLLYQSPVICPIWDQDRSCSNRLPCADILLVGHALPHMNGFDLLKAQKERGCRVPIKNKALLASTVDRIDARMVTDLGCAFFTKPINFPMVSAWLSKREQYIDLSQRLGVRRLENRYECEHEVIFTILPDQDRLKGLAVNVSPSGLCLTLKSHLDQERKILIHQKTGLGPSRPASVRWTKEIGRGLYRAGLQYQS